MELNKIEKSLPNELRPKKKKSFVEKGKMISNIMKFVSVIFVITSYILISIANKQMMLMEEVKGLLLIGFYIYAPFLPIDASLIIRSAFGEKK